MKESNKHDEAAEIAPSYKNLGRVFDDQLKWDLNTDGMISRESFSVG